MLPLLAFKKAGVMKKKTSAYSTQSTPQTNQVIRRPLTDADLELVSTFYRRYQNRLRALGILSIALFIANTYILWDIIMDWTVSFMLYFFMFIIGVTALGLSLKTILVRKRISATLQEGTAIEVQGLAYRNPIGRNISSWTVGPFSVALTPETLNMIQEGMQARVVCFPRLKVALSVNNVGLRHGAPIKCPANFEALATSEQIVQEASSEEEIHTLETILDESTKFDERLTKLKALKDKGLITEQDYENKKKEILIDI